LCAVVGAAEKPFNAESLSSPRKNENSRAEQRTPTCSTLGVGTIMNELELRKEILAYEELFNAFEGLLKVHYKFFVSNDRLATALCELYAIMSAYQVLGCMGATGQFEIAAIRERGENHFGACESLPKHKTVQNAGRELLAALASGDQAGASDALREMGVLALCPSSESIFARMEAATQRVTGHAQQVPLVDLSRFAAKVRDYERASNYLQQARKFDLNSWELYNARLIEGLIALNAGRADEAVECLAQSIRACLAYEKARAQCCIRAPRLELAEKLLDRGKREAVRRHLLDCRDVWESLQPQIDSWIQVIDNQGKPNFQCAGEMMVREKPSNTLRMQWMNACRLAESPVSAEEKATLLKSPADRRAEGERWMAENQHVLNAVVSRTIAYLDKDIVAPDDRPSTNPSDSDQPE
jgi:tetratricopeptide (TPR) repeat protein